MAFFDYNLKEKLQEYKFGAYLRRSSEDNEDKQVRSIEGQQQDLQEVSTKLRLSKLKKYDPESKSAFKIGRPIFSQIIQDIENGVIDALLVWHANRISRNYGDGGKFVQLMSEGKLKIVLTPFGVFENTPRDMEYLMNEFTRATRDSGDKSDAVKRGNRIKLKAGYIPSGRLSEGYDHVKNERGESVNGTNSNFTLLRKTIELVLNGTHTPMEALDVLNNEWKYQTRKTKRLGGKSLAKSTFYRLLSNPKSYGLIISAEGEFTAEFPPLMTKEEYEKIQILLGKKAGRRRTPKTWAYTGEITCDSCSGFITMEDKWQVICPVCKTKFHKSSDRFACINCHTPIEEMRNPKLLHYTWLHCTRQKLADGTKCRQPYLAVDNFDGQVQSLIEKFTIPEGFAKWAIKWLEKLNDQEVQQRTVINTNLQKFHNDVQKQIDDLLDLRLKGLIDDAEYQKKKETLLLEKKEVNQKLQVTDKRADEWLDLCENTFNFATYAHIWFAKGTTNQKRAILHALGSNLILKDKVLLIQQARPFMLLAGTKEKVGIKLQTIEPNDQLDVVAQKLGSEASSLDLLPSRDSNPNKQIQILLSYH